MKNGTALLLYYHLKILENRAVLKSVIGQFLTGLFGLLAVEHLGVIFQNVMVPANEIGHSRGGASTKIHAVADAYGYPVYFIISEGQRNDINYAIPLLEHINTNGSNVLERV